MKVTRRAMLRAAAALGAAAPLCGCDSAVSELTRRFGQCVPDTVSLVAGAEIDPVYHLLSRAAFGPWPGDCERVRSMGQSAWIEEQLNPEKIDDGLCEMRARRYETIHLDPGSCYDFKREALRKDLVRYKLLRSVYSKRQLLEVMVDFWTDHLNINIEKGDCIYLKATDDRQVIRKNALGRFRDLIKMSVTSPAMLVYLDGKENKKEGPHGVPNENYARELLELHTLGVHGGYTQKDVYEVARCLTGWRLTSGWGRGKVYFDGKLHDDGEKRVLGRIIPAGGGEKDVELVVDIVCAHPETAKHIARKMVTRFVCEDPPARLVERVAKTYRAHDGQIKPMLRTILYSDDFQRSAGAKLKRPFHYVVSSLRAMGADTHAHDELVEYLTRMGHAPFQYPTPDGYPEEAAPWLGTLLWRWNFAFAAASNQIPSVHVDIDRLCKALAVASSERGEQDKLFAYFIGRSANNRESSALGSFVAARDLKNPHHMAELVGLILSSPAFQRC
ncbi:MAG TPA: DUF1800 domain-containing protein [Candidatus Obscuribacterales bacterium]